MRNGSSMEFTFSLSTGSSMNISLKGSHFLEQDFGHWLVHSTMEVNADAYVLSYCVADSLNVLQAPLNLVPGIDVLEFFGAVHVHCP